MDDTSRKDARMNRWGVGAWLTLIVATFVLTGGCSQETRYRVLSTIFDGVPHPDSVAAAKALAKSQPDTIASVDDASSRRSTSSLVTHPPFADEQCDQCHVLEGEGRFSGSARLRAPEGELCTSCHPHMAADTLRIDHGWIHGPVAAGACTGCHSPHRSLNAHLLHAPPGRELCVRCHDGNRLATSPPHDENDTKCLDCHNAHAAPEMARTIGSTSAAGRFGGTP